MDYLDVADRVWPITNRLMGLHTLAYRLTGGLVGRWFPGGVEVLLLDHVGAKSGKKRTSPLLFIRDGETPVIVASKGGYTKHPGWYHNLRANPETTIQIGPKRLDVRARVANAQERKRLWPKAVAAYRDYEKYQARTDREIPLVILEPV